MDKKQVISWCLFDFANSSYSAVIAAVIFPVYYAKVIVARGPGVGDLWWGAAISVSMLVVSLSSPFLGGVADYAGLRKRFLAIYTLACIFSVASFSLLHPGMALAGFLLIITANMGMEGGLVFYNSFLPRIAPPEYQGRVSGWGFGIGYAGSILSLVLAYIIFLTADIRIIWPAIAAFFLLFSIPSFLFLPADAPQHISLAGAGKEGMRKAWQTLKDIWNQKEARKFLAAYLIYEDGVNTVIVFSSLLASTTFGFSDKERIILYIAVQAAALAGAFILSKPTDVWGPKKVVMISLVLWSIVSIAAFMSRTKTHFWIVACTAGLGLGSVQAGTRAFFTQFVPEGKEAEYFGVYSLIGKSSAVIGPLVFGSASASLGQRYAILFISAFFMAGLGILGLVKGGGPNIRGKR